MEASPLVTYGLLILGLIYSWRWIANRGRPELSHIPTMGPGAPILSYWGAYKWVVNSAAITKEGYQKYKDGFFKIATPHCWIVFVPSPKLVDEMRKSHDFSFSESIAEVLEFRYTTGKHVVDNLYQVSVVKYDLTQGLPLLFPEIHDEIIATCVDLIPDVDDWSTINAWFPCHQLVARMSNRSFVGLPFCRDPEFVKATTKYAEDIAFGSLIIGSFPTFLKPFAARHLTHVHTTIDIAEKCLGAEIRRRLAQINEHGPNYPGKPFDFLSWLIDGAEGEDRIPRNLVIRILVACFAAIQNTSTTLTNCVLRIAAHPEYAAVLREEVDNVVKIDGWSQTAVNQMHKLDSFVKETIRKDTIGSVGIFRKSSKDFTFSDGTYIPKGTVMASVGIEVAHDSEYWEDPHAFKPWRFSDARERAADGAFSKEDLTTTSLELQVFGLGRHGCPGRWFAALMLKLSLAHLVVNYDMKAEQPGVVPPHSRHAGVKVPSKEAVIFVRKRQN